MDNFESSDTDMVDPEAAAIKSSNIRFLISSTDSEAENDKRQPGKSIRKSAPNARKRRKYSTESLDSNDLDVSSTTITSKVRGRSGASGKASLKKYILSIQNNPALLEAATTVCVEKMIQLAAQNLRNYKDIEFLEWSEYVFMQLCTLKNPIDPNTMIWKQLTNMINEAQWTIEVSHNIRKYIDVKMTLLQILEVNHQYKIKKYNLNPLEVFVTKPKIDYTLLKTYKPSTESISRPLYRNRIPTKFKKIVYTTK